MQIRHKVNTVNKTNANPKYVNYEMKYLNEIDIIPLALDYEYQPIEC